MYKLTKQGNSVIRLSDGVCIPFAEGNGDYAAYKAWLAAGNTPQPVDPETPEQTQARLAGAVQKHLDAAAAARGYDNILSACSYAAAPNNYQTEGQAFLAWRAACWDKCYQILTAVQAGTRAIPTEAELLAELPVLVLP